jgi:hypothetical protein
MSTAVAVDTVVLGDVHAEAGVTEEIGVPDRTLWWVSENAQVVTAGTPPPGHDEGSTQIARYQADALMGPPVVGTLNVAFSVLTRVASASQNMNS